MGYFQNLLGYFDKLLLRCKCYKDLLENNLTINNTFLLLTFHRNITHSVIITRRATKKLKSLKYEGGGRLE